MGWMKKPRPVAEVVDARPWMIAPHTWISATKVATAGPAVTMTISARAEVGTAIPAGTVIGTVPADYRPRIDVYALGQSIGGEGMLFRANGDIVSPAIAAGSYFKVSAGWTR